MIYEIVNIEDTHELEVPSILELIDSGSISMTRDFYFKHQHEE